MPQEILAENGMKFAIAAAVVLLGLLCLALVLWIIRGRPSSPFIRGGRNRTPRLAVLDAAAIDTRRRLVLVRRDDVEHLVMIGGPTDIVIESRIVSAAAEAAPAAEKPVEKALRAEPSPAVQEAIAKTAETPLAARSATAGVAAGTVPLAAERQPAALPEGVSAMSKVLYSGDEDAAVRALPARPAQQPAAVAQQAQTGTQQRVPERRVEEMLEQNRQRVLSPQTAATVTQPVQRPVTSAAITNPTASAADNPALVSEFEKILEAEMANNAAAAATVPARTVTQPTTNPMQTAAMIGQGQSAAKSREETEAEMARLLGEIAANRKA
ncbi:flagellar biosynthetic protein FliO [Shinella zoogloeoides]|uniref:flagellar biosynthetic protein FliO n=1 Tax=Shinella zoogloeoides TaxID=352475 RepID=UPI000E65440A|nr:flagellar biosynthetic protein FliO [Shinella zoogloeoides]